MIDQESHQKWHEDKTDPSANEDCAQSRHIPWDTGIFSRPSEPEDTDDEDYAANHCAEETILGGREAFPLFD